VKVLLRKLAFGLVAATVLAVAAGVLVVSAAYALFALLRDMLGPSWAAAAVALAAAVLIGLVGLVFVGLAKTPKRRPGAADDQDLLQKVIAMARERPIVSAGALIGFVTMAIRNPALIAIVMKVFLDPKSRPEPKKKGRF
jgi:hypothetical protein